MGRYEVTGPDGSRYIFEAPDENALNEAIDEFFAEPAQANAGRKPQASTAPKLADPQRRSGPQYTPVDYDPFSPQGQQARGGPQLIPVDHDPFAPAAPQGLADRTDPSRQQPMAEPGFMERAGKNLRFGAQAVGEGAANVLGFPVDAMTAVAVNPAIWAKNSIFGGDTPLVTEPMGGSAGLKKGIREILDAAGGATNPEALGFKERALFEGISGATGALAGGAGLAKEGARRATEETGKRLPKMLDAAVKPYVDDAGQALTRDVAGGVGSGFGLASAQELPDSWRAAGGGAGGTVADVLASLAGSVGGMGANDFLRSTKAQLKSLAGAPFGASLAKDIPIAPDGDWTPYTKRSADMASEIYQGAATRPDAAPEFLASNRADLEPTLGQRLPTSGAMAEDPGIVALERRMAMADPNPMIRRDQGLNAAVRDTVDSVAPEGADTANLVNAAKAEAERLRGGAQQQADAQIADRQARVDTVRGRSEAVEGIRREDAAPLAPYQSADAAAGASRRLDEAIVGQTYLPDRAQKNGLYGAVDPQRTEMVDAQPMVDAAARVRQQINELGPQGQQLPGEFVQRIERLAPDMQTEASGVLGPDGKPLTREVNRGGDGRAAVGDIVDLQKYTGKAREDARAAGNFDLADNISALRRGGQEAVAGSPTAAAADANYRENFAPKYRAGPGDEMQRFTKDIDRDSSRSTTPPTETAGRSLSGPEKIASLRRVLDSSPAGEAGNAAVRDYLLSDLATSGVIDQRTGAIRPDRLRAWRNQWGSNLDAAPGFAGEVDDMIARAGKGERVSGGLTDQVKRAEGQLRETAKSAGRDVAEVDAQINKGALGMVMDADPDKTVAAIMSDTNKSARRLGELVELTKNDEQARAGLKAAVRDYLVDKSTTTATEKLPAGDSRGPLSFAKVQKLFNEHEAQLAQVFTPEEMNSLRVVHKALEVQNLERVRVRSGSDSVEKLAQGNFEKFMDSPTGKAFEAVLRIKYGMLKGGGIVAMGRRYMAGLTPEDGNRAVELLERAAFDPDLAMVLATRKIPPGSPKYNALIQRGLAASAGARATMEENDKKPLELTVRPNKS